MTRLLHIFAPLVLLAATLVSGWVHGLFVQRWGQSDLLDVAAARLGRDLPAHLGPWRLAQKLDVEKDVQQALKCPAYLHGIYTNAQTGDSVEIALVVGPGGPLAVHTPEICYSASDYELPGQRQICTFDDKAGQSHSLWKIYANSRQPTRPNLRVLYGWSQGRQWEAVSGPRFALAGQAAVYKLQVAGPVPDDIDRKATDPCQDFLARFLAEIQPRLVASRSRTH